MRLMYRELCSVTSTFNYDVHSDPIHLDVISNICFNKIYRCQNSDPFGIKSPTIKPKQQIKYHISAADILHAKSLVLFKACSDIIEGLFLIPIEL